MKKIADLEKISFVFIIGMGRSGTTLLQTILGSNSQSKFAPESKLIIHLKNKYSAIQEWTPELIDDLINDLYKDGMFSLAWKVDKEKLQEDLLRLLPEGLTFRTICKVIYLSNEEFFEQDEIRLIGDKNPVYSMFVSELRELFPDAKFIHIIRDYRGTILSNKTLFKRKNVGVLAQVWKRYSVLIEREKKQIPNSFYTIRYEDLVNNPEHYIMEICAFLNISFSQEMIHYHDKIKEKLQDKNLALMEIIHPNIKKPINSNQVDTWKSGLTKMEIEMADFVAAQVGKTYNYLPIQSYSKTFYLKSLYWKMAVKMDEVIIKGYYASPFFIRDALRFVSVKLFSLFKYSTIYNEQDFAYGKKQKK